MLDYWFVWYWIQAYRRNYWHCLHCTAAPTEPGSDLHAVGWCPQAGEPIFLAHLRPVPGKFKRKQYRVGVPVIWPLFSHLKSFLYTVLFTHYIRQFSKQRVFTTIFEITQKELPSCLWENLNLSTSDSFS